jgi:hypothetical protein
MSRQISAKAFARGMTHFCGAIECEAQPTRRWSSNAARAHALMAAQVQWSKIPARFVPNY